MLFHYILFDLDGEPKVSNAVKNDLKPHIRGEYRIVKIDPFLGRAWIGLGIVPVPARMDYFLERMETWVFSVLLLAWLVEEIGFQMSNHAREPPWIRIPSINKTCFKAG